MPPLTGSLPKLIQQGLQTDGSLPGICGRLRPGYFTIPAKQKHESLETLRLLVDIVAGPQSLNKARLIL